jgi:hypothetical protein
MLSRQREHFSEVFYLRHRQHVVDVLRRLALLLIVSGLAGPVWLVLRFFGEGDADLASIATAVFLWLVWVACVTLPDQFRVRLLPYFQRRLGDTDTWLAGESLLWHSQRLDAIALELGVRPLSDFASGDDMIPGEVLEWFPPYDALQTTEQLLQTSEVNSLSSDVVSDFTRLRDALRLACSENVPFCLLLREGSSTSGFEMDQRKGSFF